MLMTSVTGIYYRHTGIIGDHFRGTFPGMPDDNDIGVTTDYPCHVSNALPLGERGCLGIGDTDNTATKPVHCRLKRQPRPGTGFEEQACQNFTATHPKLFIH